MRVTEWLLNCSIEQKLLDLKEERNRFFRFKIKILIKGRIEEWKIM